MIQMQVQGIALDPVTNMPVVVLKAVESDEVLSIWIGTFEANAIAMKLENVKMPRPMTHDLIKSLIDNLNAKVEYIHINDLQSSTYYAEIVLSVNGQKIPIDSRPSDAINVAIRCNAPIFVSPHVLETAKADENLDIDVEDLKEWLETIKPEDFKKEEI
jgi:bifunctional DNase/RNase